MEGGTEGEREVNGRWTEGGRNVDGMWTEGGTQWCDVRQRMRRMM